MDSFGFPNRQQDYLEAQRIPVAILTSSPSGIAWNLFTQQNAEVTLTGSVTLLNPIGIRRGTYYAIEVIQDSTGGRALAFGSAYKNVSTIVLTTTATYSNLLLFKAYSDTLLELVSNNLSIRS